MLLKYLILNLKSVYLSLDIIVFGACTNTKPSTAIFTNVSICTYTHIHISLENIMLQS